MPRSALPHHCFSVVEILERILSYVQTKNTLATLARTCLSFRDPALDALYGELDELGDLLRCLSSDVVASGLEQLVRFL